VISTWEEVCGAVDALLAGSERVLLGIGGPPGAGKSTLAAAVVRYVGSGAVLVPMDGFHLADVELDRLGLRRRKGAIDTFDGYGYVALLRRLRAETSNTVYAPVFGRELEQPVAGAVAVAPTVRLVVTDGNYLLDDEPPWDQVRQLVDQTWYVHLDDDVRRPRLVARHEQFGKVSNMARVWEQTVDQPNAVRIAAGRERADQVVDLTGIDLGEGPRHTPDTTDDLVPVRDDQPGVVLVVDAANVVGSRADGWWRDRVGATRRLLVPLAGLPGRSTSSGQVTRVVAVVEGQAKAVPDIGGIDVVRAPNDGDTTIVEVVADLDGPALVVTADQGLRARLGDTPAVGPQWLWNLLDTHS